jgi:hypothetical protein
MENIKSADELRDVILQLEHRQVIQEQLLKEQFHIAYTSFTPANIIKNTLRQAVSSREVQDDIIEYAANLAADFITNQFIKGSSDNYWKKYLRHLLHYGITTIITLNSDTIRSFGESLLNKFLEKNKNDDSSLNEKES